VPQPTTLPRATNTVCTMWNVVHSCYGDGRAIDWSVLYLVESFKLEFLRVSQNEKIKMVKTIRIAVYENSIGDTSIFQKNVFERGSFYLIMCLV
jgi:hypothetical protein